MGTDMSSVYGQAMESMDRVYTNIGIHRYTRSCTQGQTHISSPALLPRARANLSSILTVEGGSRSSEWLWEGPLK